MSEDHLYDVIYDYGEAVAEMQSKIDRLENTIKVIDKQRDVLDISHKSLAHQLARCGLELTNLRLAVIELLNDVRQRHPGEELRCPYMRRLDELIKGGSA